MDRVSVRGEHICFPSAICRLLELRNDGFFEENLVLKEMDSLTCMFNLLMRVGVSYRLMKL